MRLLVQDHINRGMRHVLNLGIRRLALIYRFLNPHIVVEITKAEPPIFGDSTKPEELRELIKSTTRFEHLVSGASNQYRLRREEIANEAYGNLVEVVRTK